MAIISFLIITLLVFLVTTYSIYLPFSDYSLEFVVTSIMYFISVLGIGWHSTLDYILHNLFSKQSVIIQSARINKFHVKKAISFSTWIISLLWAILLFVGMTINEQINSEHYQVYIIVFALFYTIMSSVRILWKDQKHWWVYDLLFAIFIKLTIAVITSALYLFIFKIM